MFRQFPFNELVQAARESGMPYDMDLDGTQASISKQAERIAADIVSKGGTFRRGNLMTFDAQAVALIAYLQRLGADLTAPAVAEKTDDAAEVNDQDVSDAIDPSAGSDSNKVVSFIP